MEDVESPFSYTLVIPLAKAGDSILKLSELPLAQLGPCFQFCALYMLDEFFEIEQEVAEGGGFPSLFITSIHIPTVK